MPGNISRRAQNPLEVANARIPDLLIGEPYQEIASRSGLKDVFEGPLAK